MATDALEADPETSNSCKQVDEVEVRMMGRGSRFGCCNLSQNPKHSLLRRNLAAFPPIDHAWAVPELGCDLFHGQTCHSPNFRK
jgi:hypothetical protein